LYIPNYGAYIDGKWIIEGTGASPDIEVNQDPAAVMAGRDPQLDKAIAVLKELVAKKAPKHEEHPAFPKKGVGSGGGS
jgi:tricorn protease